MTNFPHGGKSEIFFLPYALDLIGLFQFEGKTDVWISQVKRGNETCDLSKNFENPAFTWNISRIRCWKPKWVTEHYLSKFELLSACSCESKAFYILYFCFVVYTTCFLIKKLLRLAKSWQIFEEKSNQICREIWIQVLVSFLQLYWSKLSTHSFLGYTLVKIDSNTTFNLADFQPF